MLQLAPNGSFTGTLWALLPLLGLIGMAIPPDPASPGPPDIHLPSGITSDSGRAVPGQATVLLRSDLPERIRSDTLSPERALARSTSTFGRLDDSLRIGEVRPVIPRIESDTGRAARRLDDLFVLEFAHENDPQRVAQAIDSISWIRAARPNEAYPALRPEGTPALLPDRNQAITQMAVPEAHRLTRGDTSVQIGIIDTGLDTSGLAKGIALRNGRNVVDIDTTAWKQRGYALERGENYTHPGDLNLRRSGHGSMLTRAIAGEDGVCPRCSIIPLRAGFLARFPMDGNERTVSRFEADDIAAALVWATDQNADIINLSLAVAEPSKVLALGINYAYRRGVLIVAASGNQGRGQIPYPAAYPHVLAVGAASESGRRAPFSNYGEALDLVAPGIDVRPDAYAYHLVQGTSLSAAYVSGVAGLVQSLWPGARRTELRSVLRRSANLPTLIDNERTPELGYGLLQASRAARLAADRRRSFFEESQIRSQ